MPKRILRAAVIFLVATLPGCVVFTCSVPWAAHSQAYWDRLFQPSPP